MKKTIRTFAALAALAIGSNAFALSLGDVTGGGKEKGAATASVDDVAGRQESLVKRYVSAATHINEAQLRMSEALGLKQQVASLQDTATVLGSGAVLDKDAIKKVSATSEDADAAIRERLEAGEALSTESQQTLARSLVPFGMGLKETKKLTNEFKPFMESATAAIKDAPMTQKLQAKSKLAAGLYVAKNTPGLLNDLIGTSQQLMGYMQSQNVKVPDEASDALGDL